MTHKDAGKYGAKHPGANLDERIASHIKEKITDNTISCAEAHRIAGDLDIDPVDVGTTIDLLEVRIKKCQLGLFGYRPKLGQDRVDNACLGTSADCQWRNERR